MTTKRTYHNSVFVTGNELENCTRLPQLLESYDSVLVEDGNEAAMKYAIESHVPTSKIKVVKSSDIGLLSSRDVIVLGEADQHIVAMIGVDHLIEMTDTTKLLELSSILTESADDQTNKLFNVYGKEHYANQEEVYRKEFKSGYTLIKTKMWGKSPYHGDDEVTEQNALNMTVAYNNDGQYLGSSKNAHFYCNKLGIKPETSTKGSGTVCNNGWSEKSEMWYGWSHRAIVGFKIGDKLFDPKFKDKTDNTKFVEHGDITIKNKADARQAAINFASYVS